MHTPDKFSYLLKMLKEDPAELIRLVSVGLTTLKFRYLKRCIGKGTTVEPQTQIINAANVQIGQNCLLKEAIYIRAGATGRVTIGDRAAINAFCRIFGHGTVTIGEDTQIGPGVLITTTGHDYRNSLETHFEPIRIGKGVWIGANVTILPGIEIGDHVVIGAGAVVNKSIPARSVAVGIPAKVIKTLDFAESAQTTLPVEAKGNNHSSPPNSVRPQVLQESK
jgi:acetyltransferase-like isoleucine patch superfamily enzyme